MPSGSWYFLRVLKPRSHVSFSLPLFLSLRTVTHSIRSFNYPMQVAHSTFNASFSFPLRFIHGFQFSVSLFLSSKFVSEHRIHAPTLFASLLSQLRGFRFHGTSCCGFCPVLQRREFSFFWIRLVSEKINREKKRGKTEELKRNVDMNCTDS